ncbi:MAG: COX15/CtaA family protein [Polaribacter sp.]|mgnify:FL=1|jgi:cytochrome c oxidase assembly protein subunit 15|uniref:COX15/CtaA family protein n=1 Tax=Polaribacter sp. TaxID=1920175 RepID=UPI0026199C15|nr:COX15/CtaA family protein [Polaribacter sp.]MBT3742725.1 heme A synthase [Polaribacter sp.]MBT4413769.1 heme A synthase [Polaribacter sp.]MBT7816903.1 heme A synthase [Polaribacter sp.]MDG1194327.1 COX15/CtaA family protein [Polaribacter sp.]MDG1402627.1 COX15/CtaA family protein [Polaribacter sp.]
MKSRFPKIVQIAIISVYLIFLAGSIVRMTGSGMGCPDWPKCFGYYIPPTSEEQISWKPNTEFKKGFIIIKDEVLFVAESDVKTSSEFNKNNWKNYTKHDYAKFNKYHTWTEYINRLASVLSGFVFLFLIYGAAKFWKTKKIIPLLSFAAFFLMLFEAWLGKTVVDTNLKPTIITIHMVVGLVIIALLLQLKFIISDEKKVFKYNSIFNKLLLFSVIFSLIQIAMGTQVRQFIDEQVKLFGFENKEYSLMNPSFKFYFHRSFTIAIVLVNFGMFYLNQIKNLGYKLVNWIVFLIFLETITGILMYYAEFPLGTQAIHLLSGAILFGLQFYLWLQSRSVKNIQQ